MSEMPATFAQVLVVDYTSKDGVNTHCLFLSLSHTHTHSHTHAFSLLSLVVEPIGIHFSLLHEFCFVFLFQIFSANPIYLPISLSQGNDCWNAVQKAISRNQIVVTPTGTHTSSYTLIHSHKMSKLGYSCSLMPAHTH